MDAALHVALSRTVSEAVREAVNEAVHLSARRAVDGDESVYLDRHIRVETLNLLRSTG